MQVGAFYPFSRNVSFFDRIGSHSKIKSQLIDRWTQQTRIFLNILYHQFSHICFYFT